MQRNSVQVRLDDILEAIDGIQALVLGMSFQQFAAVWHVQRATERGLEIISEASRSIPDELKAIEPAIPWREIASIGNLLRHEYQRVEPLIIWNIVEQHLTNLQVAARNLSAQLNN